MQLNEVEGRCWCCGMFLDGCFCPDLLDDAAAAADDDDDGEDDAPQQD